MRHTANPNEETYDFVMWTGLLPDLYEATTKVFRSEERDFMRLALLDLLSSFEKNT